MNGYKAFYKSKTCDVVALTTLEAQEKAAKILKAKKQWEVSVYLCEKNGEQVSHTFVD
jgi:hypothetical protein